VKAFIVWGEKELPKDNKDSRFYLWNDFLKHLCWEAIPMMNEAQKSDPSMSPNSHRIVSYLPLSHIAGLAVDLMSHIYAGHELYFAKPDALAGTLVQTLTWARPTIFFAVPRVWEKFEEKLKEIASTKP